MSFGSASDRRASEKSGRKSATHRHRSVSRRVVAKRFNQRCHGESNPPNDKASRLR
jgi:hypothetical protein